MAFLNSDNTVSVALGNGDGTFRPSVDYAIGARATEMHIGDVNGDQRLDLIVLLPDSGAADNRSASPETDDDRSADFKHRADIHINPEYY